MSEIEDKTRDELLEKQAKQYTAALLRICRVETADKEFGKTIKNLLERFNQGLTYLNLESTEIKQILQKTGMAKEITADSGKVPFYPLTIDKNRLYITRYYYYQDLINKNSSNCQLSLKKVCRKIWI